MLRPSQQTSSQLNLFQEKRIHILCTGQHPFQQKSHVRDKVGTKYLPENRLKTVVWRKQSMQHPSAAKIDG